MRTLVVCREAPFPATTGSPLRLWQQINLLHSLGPVYVFSIGSAINGPARAPLIAEWDHIDMRDFKTPSLPTFLRLAKLFRPTQYPGVGDFSDRTLNKRLSAFIERVKPDLTILSHWGNAMPAALRNSKPIIIDSHNIESKLWSDTQRSGNLINAIRHWRFTRDEVRLSEAASATWVTSELDEAFLLRTSKKPLSVTVWPNAIDLSYYANGQMTAAADSLALARQFPTLIFVGYMAYSPNHEAARLLINEILPKVRPRYPHVRALIVGKNPREDLISLASSQPNVVVTGTVDDVRPYLALSDLAVVPLLVGGGTRLKLLEAFASKLPVVSTSKGAEGIAIAGSNEVTIADTPDEMVREILGLLDDERRRTRQVDCAYERVRSQYSWQALMGRLPGEISTIMGTSHR